jgi:hypothetical protein
MATQLQLQLLLEQLLGSRNVYFQPPKNSEIKYPAIVYHRSDEATDYANNNRYQKTWGYDVTVIDQNPLSEFPDMVGKRLRGDFSRFFTADQLNHTVYKIYF